MMWNMLTHPQTGGHHDVENVNSHKLDAIIRNMLTHPQTTGGHHDVEHVKTSKTGCHHDVEHINPSTNNWMPS